MMAAVMARTVRLRRERCGGEGDRGGRKPASAV